MQPPEIIGAIVVFRLYYYLIPLFLAGGLFAGNEMLLRGRGLLAPTARRPTVQAIGRWTQPAFIAAETCTCTKTSGIPKEAIHREYGTAH